MRRALGIVRRDIAGVAAETVAAGIRALARVHRIQLDEIVFRDSSEGLVRLLANLPDSVDLVMIPSEAHLGAWIPAARRTAEVWSVDRGVCWPQGEGRTRLISRPDRLREIR
ncbi:MULTISPECIES: hypothetical protein [Nocardia]|uniref:Uncharacterized protein n=2 Tax=Nocardia TaxID=1817 RepID=A0A366D4Q5_9NOCA|nr:MULTISPECIES: hypothetical protein [Nocardia]RBO84499.1 hypothetical protein DFR74_11660 [Nocardia puris]MBF6540988.1 hypothetical protein [Nocardia farcinica]MCP2287157.1 hypothetical protein [Nocardia amikacinitolerans]NKY35768.1 hypothetical protein [Nocardia speluncae]UGT65900.1 hypothetical protein LTT66_21590 [Nocardia gipuzkoensis]